MTAAARDGLADQIEMAVFGEQTKGRTLHPKDVAQIAVTVVGQWGCPNCRDSREDLESVARALGTAEMFIKGSRTTELLGAVIADAEFLASMYGGFLDRPSAVKATHTGGYTWKNGAELVWECDDDCQHASHDEDA